MSGRRVEFIIDYPRSVQERRKWCKHFGLNSIYSGKHWTRRDADTQYWHFLVLSELQRQNVPFEVFSSPVRIKFFWHDNMDIDNHAYMSKLIVDALKGRLLVDDSREYFQAVAHEFHDRDYIRVILEEA